MGDCKSEDHFHHHKLGKFEKKLISDRTDFPVISLIDNLTPYQLEQINNSLYYKQDCLAHSNSLQIGWMKNYMYFWGEKNKKDPNKNTDWINDFRKSIHPSRYRIWFAVHYPNEVEIIENEGDSDLTKKFLDQARKEFNAAYSRKQRRYHRCKRKKC